MAINRGKQFEKVIQKGFEKLPYVTIDRQADPTSGYMGVRTYCDFIVYRYPNQYFIECKAISGNTLNFDHHITLNQWNGLWERSQVEGVIAGVMVWFTEHGVMGFLDIRVLHEMQAKGLKSFNIKDFSAYRAGIIPIGGIRKRILYDYDLAGFLQLVEARRLWEKQE